MKLINRDLRHLTTPRLVRIWKALRRPRPMAVAIARKASA